MTEQDRFYQTANFILTPFRWLENAWKALGILVLALCWIPFLAYEALSSTSTEVGFATGSRAHEVTQMFKASRVVNVDLSQASPLMPERDLDYRSLSTLNTPFVVTSELAETNEVNLHAVDQCNNSGGNVAVKWELPTDASNFWWLAKARVITEALIASEQSIGALRIALTNIKTTGTPRGNYDPVKNACTLPTTGDPFKLYGWRAVASGLDFSGAPRVTYDFVLPRSGYYTENTLNEVSEDFAARAVGICLTAEKDCTRRGFLPYVGSAREDLLPWGDHLNPTQRRAVDRLNETRTTAFWLKIAHQNGIRNQDAALTQIADVVNADLDKSFGEAPYPEAHHPSY